MTDFTFIPKKYRPIPFWSWNDKLDVRETEEQINKMHRAGAVCFFCPSSDVSEALDMSTHTQLVRMNPDTFKGMRLSQQDRILFSRDDACWDSEN